MKQLRKELDKNRLSKLILLDKIFDNLFTKAEKNDFDEIKNKHESPVKLAPFDYNIKSSYYEWISEVIENDIKRRRKIKFKVSPDLQTIILVFKTLNVLSKGKYTKEFNDELNYFKDSIEKTKIDSDVNIIITDKLENWWNFLYNKSGKNKLTVVDKAIVNFSNNLMRLSNIKDDNNENIDQKLADIIKFTKKHNYINYYNKFDIGLDFDTYGVLVKGKYLFNVYTHHVPKNIDKILKDNNMLPENGSVFGNTKDIYFNPILRAEYAHKKYSIPVSHLIRSYGSDYNTSNIFNSEHIPFNIKPNVDSLNVNKPLFADLSESDIAQVSSSNDNIDYSLLNPIRYWLFSVGGVLKNSNLPPKQQVKANITALANMIYGDNQPAWVNDIIENIENIAIKEIDVLRPVYFGIPTTANLSKTKKQIVDLNSKKIDELKAIFKKINIEQQFNENYVSNIFERYFKNKSNNKLNAAFNMCNEAYKTYIKQKKDLIVEYLYDDEIVTSFDKDQLELFINALSKYDVSSKEY